MKVGETMEYEGINKFARVMQSRMSQMNESPLVLDFGVIQSDMSLKTNSYDIPIPAKDYLVCRSLLVGAVGDVLTTTKADQGNHGHGLSGGHTGHQSTEPITPPSVEGEHMHPDTEGKHNHDILIPETLRRLKSGDRVLVAWVGNDAVVVDIIMSL